MYNNDFENFKQEVGWFVEQNDSVKIGYIISKTFSIKFTDTFPILYKLLLQTTSIFNVNVINAKNISSNYHLYTWTDKNGLKCGWLCKNKQIEPKIELIPEHQLFLDEMGTIEEIYNHFNNVDILKDERAFTLCTKNRATAFIDNIETLSKEWLDHIGTEKS